MQKKTTAEFRNQSLLLLVILGLTGALFIVPFQFRSQAVSSGIGFIQKTESHSEGLENYDIREQQDPNVAEALSKYRLKTGKDSAMVADIRDGFVRGEEILRSKIPGIKVEYNRDLRIPEVITPDMWRFEVERLTAPSEMKRSEILRNFVKQNNNLIGVSDVQADNLKVTADYQNPNGKISFAYLEQTINGIPVFRGEVKAGFTKSGEIIRVINNLAPGLDYENLSTDFRNPLDAVKAAHQHINSKPTKLDPQFNESLSTGAKAVFGNGEWATVAEKMYFPTEPGIAIPSWRVLVWQPVNAFYVIVDAESGRMLWRKNITEDQTQNATFDVYANSNGYINGADSPAPLSPGPLNPTTGQQGAIIARNLRTLIGNEPSNSFNNNGWITDNTNITDGNALEAGIDRDGINGVDATQTGDTGCPGAGCRTFTSTWNPPPGNPAPGDSPLTAQAQRGAVVQMFYIMNLYHDALYNVGFTEAARNFQNDNFGRGGLGADRVSGEGQDSGGTNNANFSTPADGGRGRMQMYLWTGPTPDYDGTVDAEIIIHEVTHGLSNRLHGNASGLSTNMSRGMGEGWGDWYAYTLLAEPSDPIDGIYTTGGYATYLGAINYTANYYNGIRRFPRAPITFLGPNGKPHNPLTFRYLNSDCNTLVGTTTSNPPPSSAYPRGPFGSTTCDQVHAAGEIWSSALWEVRNRMVQRLGFTAGTTRVLQVVTDGMKLAPLGPTFLQERDAILSAASVFGADDVNDVREGFRVRGIGFSASIQSTSPASVTEAFDTWGTPNQAPTASFTFSCTGLTCNFNGSASNDPDGSIVSYSWNFGDGTTGSGATPTKTYSSSGTRTVTLTVTDNGNATGNTSQSVTVTAPPANIVLSVTTQRRNGRTTANLSWTGATGSVNVYRNNSVIATASGTTYADNLGRGSGTATYQVCNAGTATCSNQVTITY